PSPSGFFGFQWDKEKRRYLPDQNHGAAAQLWPLGLTGWTVRAIAAELTRRGIPTPGGSAGWWPYSVRHVLKNPAYAGTVEALRTEVVIPKQRRANTYGKSGRRSRPESERIRLVGLVERPIISLQEFEWMQQRLRENQERTKRNAKVRTYLLRGLVRCAACGRSYVGATFRRQGKEYSYYICGARWKPGPHGHRCQSHAISAPAFENRVYEMVVDFLHGPEGFEAEMRRRKGIAEARAFRLAARGSVSEAVYEEEVGLIRTKQRWIAEQRERVQGQLGDLERYRFDPHVVELMRERLDARLAGATPEDRRFVLESVGAKVIMQADKTWELEVQVPRQVPAPDKPEKRDLQIVNSLPGPLSTRLHI
ncbi:MAG: recombinase family protein, partial [Chloroflexi bacterium]|nr:recombinase family protein [Chloroflexota bacterium]